MRIACWNINNRVGKTRFRPEAADAAITLDSDAIFLMEYFPQANDSAFRSRLADAGYVHQHVPPPVDVRANRTFVASREPCVNALDALPPIGEVQLRSNTLAVDFPKAGVRVLCLRIPAYEGAERALVASAWTWLQSAASELVGRPAIIMGDLNTTPTSAQSQGGKHFRQLIQDGWSLATPSEPSFYSNRGTTSTPDHLLHSAHAHVASASFLVEVGPWRLAGAPGSLSDHAALVADINTSPAHSR